MLKKIVVRGKKIKRSLYHHIYLQFLSVEGYLKRSNDTPKLNIHKSNDNTTVIYINRLSTTMHISKAMDYLILMSEKYVHFRKRQKHVL